MEDSLLKIAGAIMVGMGAIGGAIGVGVAASKYLEGIARQPELQGYLLGQFFIMMALVAVSYTHLTLPTKRIV